MSLYEEPREVTDLEDCYFYHTIDLPGYGTIKGDWDLRPNTPKYLGNSQLQGKRVLDIGAASGYLTFQMEKLGADVVSYDMSDKQDWDIVPFATIDRPQSLEDRRVGTRKLNNSYWLSHKALDSRARVVYGTVYEIPDAIGPVDVSVYGSILLHLRDPFQALYVGSRLTRETIIVADVIRRRPILPSLMTFLAKDTMQFLPNHKDKNLIIDGYWYLPPSIVKKMLGVLGFTNAKITYHLQQYAGKSRWLYTVTAHRTHGAAIGS